MLSSPGCWEAYGGLLAREYEDPLLFGAAHRLTVDAYALQHPGTGQDIRALRSVWLHYASLFLIFEEGRSFAEATAALGRLAGQAFDPVERPPIRFQLTLRDVLDGGVGQHIPLVRAWARSAFDSWGVLAEATRHRLARI
jgi:hypothetical protein